MKFILTFLTLTVMAIAGSVVIQFFVAESMQERVQNVSDRVDDQARNLENVRVEHNTRLEDHEERIELVEAKTLQQGEEVSKLKTRLGELTEEVERIQSSREKDQERLQELGKEIETVQARIATLREENEGFLDEVLKLRQELSLRDRRDKDLEARLRRIEKKLGVEPPRP